jgi:CRP-like cAMP-binding protein
MEAFHMSVEQLDVIDVISTDTTGNVILAVSDHLDWSDTDQHQLILQEKLNKYLAFVESGEILESYPDAKGRPIVFRVVFKFSPDAQGYEFLTKTRAVIESAGFTLRYEVFGEHSA